jgi:VCBS repeat protein
MSRTISSSTTGPVVLNPTTDNPLYITATGTVTSTGTADGVDGGSGTSWTISNAGVISAAVTGNGVSLAGSGIVTNTGSISGNEGLVLSAGGSVTNNTGGSIAGLGPLGAGLRSGAGVYIGGAAGTVTNNSAISGVAYGVALGAGGTVTNASSITGGEDAITIHGTTGTIANFGNITGTVDDGIGLFAGGVVTNASGASISGQGTLGAAIYITGGVATITNSGSISGPNHHAVLIEAGGSLLNQASGSISAPNTGVFFKVQPGTVTNAGLITATGTDGTGVYLENGGGVTNTSTGNIVAHKFGVFLEGAAGTIANSGSISGATYDGVVLGLGGTVTNAAGASISGGSIGAYVKYRAAGTVTNSGNISGSAAGSAGIDLADGGSITNNATGSVSGNSFGVFVTGAIGTVANAGSITSTKYGAIDLLKGGSVTNAAGASIAGGSAGVYVQTGASGTVTNSGIIAAANATGAGIDLSGGGSITNNLGGNISGGGFGVFTTGALATLTNSGNISGAHGVGLEAGGSITNVASGTITGQVAGVFGQGNAVTLSNAGSVIATAGAAADIEFGGTITNLAGATLSGSSFGVFLTGGSGTVTNAGTISGASYAIDFAGSGTNRLIVDPGAVFIGQVTGGSGTSTLELASGTGSISGIGTGSFNHFQALDADTGANWTLNGANTAPTVLDNGTVNVSSSLDVTTAVDPGSTGLFQIGSSATFEVAAATGAATKIKFGGSTGELIIDSAALFGTNVGTASYAGPQLQNFGSGDKIDLKNFSLTGLALNYNVTTGVLQLSNSANQHASLKFQTSTLGSSNFAAVSDGAGGILISDVSPAQTQTNVLSSDGLNDVFWRATSGGVADWTMSGGAISISTVLTSNGAVVAPDASWSIAGMADFQGIGKADILWRNTDGTLADWSVHGSTISSSAPSFNGVAAKPGASWTIAGLSDFNGDGKADILWRNTDGTLVDWSMNQSTITSSAVLTSNGVAATPDASWAVAGLGDFNGDGKADILWRNTSGEVAVWMMNGATITASSDLTSNGVAVRPDASWSVAGIGDFNGDGKSDILWRNAGGALAVWQMNGSTVSSGAITFNGVAISPDATWHVAQIADFNGDGSSDILWRNDSGALAEWLMNGNTITQSVTPASNGVPIMPSSVWTTQAKPTIGASTTQIPELTVGVTALTVNAGGSVTLPVSVLSFDSDDTVSVTISGLTNYESLTDNLDHTTFSGSSITFTAAQVNSGLTLNSSFAGSGHPVNDLVFSASNTTAGEAATTATQTIVVTDPPTVAVNTPQSAAPLNNAVLTQSAATLSPQAPSIAGSQPAYAKLAGLLDQYIAAASSGAAGGLSQTTWSAPQQTALGDKDFLTKPTMST